MIISAFLLLHFYPCQNKLLQISDTSIQHYMSTYGMPLVKLNSTKPNYSVWIGLDRTALKYCI